MTEARHIWIIDDDDSIRFVLKKALENDGMQVTSFNSANNVLDRLNDGEPDAIITDIRMPGMDGLELLSRLSELHPTLPVIVMTAHTDLDSAVSAYQGALLSIYPNHLISMMPSSWLNAPVIVIKNRRTKFLI